MASCWPCANHLLGKAAQIAARFAALQRPFVPPRAFARVQSLVRQTCTPARLFLCKHSACFNQLSCSASWWAWGGCPSIGGAGLLLRRSFWSSATAGSYERRFLASSCSLLAAGMVVCGYMFGHSCTASIAAAGAARAQLPRVPRRRAERRAVAPGRVAARKARLAPSAERARGRY